jgi:NAD(P)-dependent dehydrogenase (short-subunit alcohol dehydrogenase family)
MLTDKIIVITGGAGLLGRSFARHIVERGGTAVLADINIEAATAAAAEITTAVGGRAEAATLDITDKDSICNLIGALDASHGRIDAVVNNAYPRNKGYGRKLEDVSYADFCDNVSRHLGGYFLTAQQFGSFFRRQGAGNIVNMASIYGVVAPRFEVYGDTAMTMPVEYAAIKSAVVHLTKYFAQYFKGHGVRVNCLSPGGILDRQPEEFLRRYNAHANEKGMLDPRDVASVLMFLLSDASQYMTGQNLLVDDGWSL